LFVADKAYSPLSLIDPAATIRHRRELCVARAVVDTAATKDCLFGLETPRRPGRSPPNTASSIGYGRHQLVLDQPSGRAGNAKLALQAQRRIPAAPVPTLALRATKCLIYNK